MTQETRRLRLIERIHKNCTIADTGFIQDGHLSPCYLWKGNTSGTGRGGGYGRISIDGQTSATHIVIYACFFGYIPGKKQIDHLCNNRLCCNPKHLEMVTHKTNQKRRAIRAKEAKV